LKKNKTILVVAVVLGLIAAFFIYNNRNSTVKEALRDFAVQDTASITKIFLADKSGNAVTLAKENGSWMVNGKFRAQEEAVQNFLITIRSLAVKTRVAKAGYNNVIKELASTGIKCEIYLHDADSPSKIIYVGGSTADVLGTFMILDGSSQPFVVEIPGFQGYLTPRFSPREKDWREMKVFSYSPQAIRSIQLLYSTFPAKSFMIEKSGTNYIVSSPVTKNTIAHPDTIAIENYLDYFRSLSFENWSSELDERQLDSLRNTEPVNMVTVTDTSGIARSMAVYSKAMTRESLARTDSSGNPLKYDPDRMFAILSSENELVTIQRYVFGKIFRQLDDFNLDKLALRQKAR